MLTLFMNRFKDIIDSLPASVRKALLNQTRPDDIEKSDLLLLDSVTLAALQARLARFLRFLCNIHVFRALRRNSSVGRSRINNLL